LRLVLFAKDGLSALDGKNNSKDKEDRGKNSLNSSAE